MLPGPRSSSLSLSFSLPLIRCSLPRFRLSSFICRPLIPFRAAVLRPLLTTSHVAVALALPCSPVNARAHSLFLVVSEDSLTRGLRVSRRALWWLLRWLLASLESSQESVPPEGQGTPSGTGSPPSLPLFTSLLPPRPFSLFLSLFLSFSPLTPSQPALCPLRCSYLRVLLIFSYYRRWACRHVSLTHPRVQPVRTRGTVHLEIQRTRPPRPPLYPAQFPMLLSPTALPPSVLRRYSNM